MKIATSHSWSGSESATWLPGWPPPRRKSHQLTSSTTSTAANTFSQGPGRLRAPTTRRIVESATMIRATTCSGARRSLKLGSHAEPVESGAMLGEPSVERLLRGRDRVQSVKPGQRRPPATEDAEHAIDRGGALQPAAGAIDGPGRAIRFLARDPESFENAGLLVGDDQHTAGPVAPADPARHACSNASSPVEKHDQVGLDAENFSA